MPLVVGLRELAAPSRILEPQWTWEFKTCICKAFFRRRRECDRESVSAHSVSKASPVWCAYERLVRHVALDHFDDRHRTISLAFSKVAAIDDYDEGDWRLTSMALNTEC